jgi:osmotically-inducible protein OsmY
MMRIVRFAVAMVMLAGFTAACAKTRIYSSTTRTVAEEENLNLAAQVKTALLNDPVVGVRRIDVHVTLHAVRLTGRVASAAERDRAVSIAKAVPGVESVTSDLQIQP